MKHRTITINDNNILLFLMCVSMLISAVWNGEVMLSYLTCFFSAYLVVIALLNGRTLLSRFLLGMTIVLCLHFLVTSDKITSVVICITMLFLYESIAKGIYSVKVILYVFLIFFLVGFILTFPDFLHSLLVVHTDRSSLYGPFFYSANIYAAFCLMTLMCVILFMKPSKIKLILTILLILNVYSTGSRNGMLFIITSICFYILHKSKYAKYSYAVFILLLLMATYYLFFIEMSTTVDFTVMGKEANSAGRANQIRYVINNFPLTLLGCGKEFIDMSIMRVSNGFLVHNFYINSLYALGIMPLLGYMYYIFKVWKSLPGIVAKSFLLAFSVYFFFEPGICYYLIFWNVMPIVIILLSKQLPEGEGNNFKLI